MRSALPVQLPVGMLGAHPPCYVSRRAQPLAARQAVHGTEAGLRAAQQHGCFHQLDVFDGNKKCAH